MERHYGMDWLRVGAFALLIFYHIGMVFVPWGYEVKTAHPLAWVEVPMFLTNPWRLTLLFVVSGYASRALYARSPSLRDFVRNRHARLLVPLLFTILVIAPPQLWVKLTTQHGYARDFLTFWATDYFHFGRVMGDIMPSWMHLWFVVYLWVYTMVLALLLMAGRWRGAQAAFDQIFGGSRALWLPLAYMLLVQWLILNRTEDTHDLVGDWVAHARYFPAFLFGFGLAGSPRAMAGLARMWRVSALLALASFAVIAALLIVMPDFSFTAHWQGALFHAAREAETWTAIAALIGVAERFWNHDHRWRPMLTEAVFPFYIIHQTIIVVVGGAIIGAGLSQLAEFAILVAATVAGCWAFYLIGREVAWLRPLIGLKLTRAAKPAKAPAIA